MKRVVLLSCFIFIPAYGAVADWYATMNTVLARMNVFALKATPFVSQEMTSPTRKKLTDEQGTEYLLDVQSGPRQQAFNNCLHALNQGQMLSVQDCAYLEQLVHAPGYENTAHDLLARNTVSIARAAKPVKIAIVAVLVAALAIKYRKAIKERISQVKDVAIGVILVMAYYHYQTVAQWLSIKG